MIFAFILLLTYGSAKVRSSRFIATRSSALSGAIAAVPVTLKVPFLFSVPSTSTPNGLVKLLDTSFRCRFSGATATLTGDGALSSSKVASVPSIATDATWN